MVYLSLITFGYAQKTYMLATAVSDYDGTQNDLFQTTKDAKTLADFYKSRGAEVMTFTGKYATHDNIIAHIRKIARTATEKDRIIFAYNGHGMEGALYSYDGNGNQPITYQELRTEFDRCKCQTVIFYINACHSGSASESIKGHKYTLFLSSRKDEFSSVNSIIGGYFSRALLKGLQGKCDQNQDRKITVMELFRYIYKDVLSRTEKKDQHPTLVTAKDNSEMVLIDWNKPKD